MLGDLIDLVGQLHRTAARAKVHALIIARLRALNKWTSDRAARPDYKPQANNPLMAYPP